MGSKIKIERKQTQENTRKTEVEQPREASCKPRRTAESLPDVSGEVAGRGIVRRFCEIDRWPRYRRYSQSWIGGARMKKTASFG